MKKIPLVLALLLAVPLANPLGADPGRVALRSGSIGAAGAASEPGGPDPRIRIFRFASPPTAAQLQALAARVERIYTYLPENSFLVRVLPGSDPAGDAAAAGAAWSGSFPAAAKISPEIAAAGKDPERLRPVLIHLFPDAGLGATVALIESLVGKKAEGSAARANFSRVRFLLTEAEIAAFRQPLAELGEVFWIEREGRKVLLNDTSIWVGQSGLTGGGATPVFDHGILGAGQVVAVLDSGIDVDSCYFWDAANLLPAMNVCSGGTLTEPAQRKVIAADFLWQDECSGGISKAEWSTDFHGTHVAGIVAGDDFAQPGVHNNRDGMAPQAKLVIQDAGFQVNACADMPGIGCPVVDLVPIFQQAYDQGARVHTNSWGDHEDTPNPAAYTAGSQDADEMTWARKDFLLVFAAGNSGSGVGTVWSPSTAKSAISVGATERGADADTLSGFSSHGPADDGRIKPDLAFPGSGIASAASDVDISTFNCGDQGGSGTSMAAPGVAGLAALVRQYYSDGFYPGGAANPPQGFAPSAALVKATLINSAVEMSETGTIPGSGQGWGRPLLDNALHFAGEPRRLFADDNAAGFASGSSGQVRTYQLAVEAGQPLKVTLAWSDFPSTPAAAINLVNDLDLVVTGPDGTFRGNVFSSGQSTTGGAADRRNTVEQVLRQNPAAGLWTVTVRSFTVPQGPQPFALVATGAFSAKGTIFEDTFESGNTSAWSQTVP
jgi:hypothetical protein